MSVFQNVMDRLPFDPGAVSKGTDGLDSLAKAINQLDSSGQLKKVSDGLTQLLSAKGDSAGQAIQQISGALTKLSGDLNTNFLPAAERVAKDVDLILSGFNKLPTSVQDAITMIGTLDKATNGLSTKIGIQIGKSIKDAIVKSIKKGAEEKGEAEVTNLVSKTLLKGGSGAAKAAATEAEAVLAGGAEGAAAGGASSVVTSLVSRIGTTLLGGLTGAAVTVAASVAAIAGSYLLYQVKKADIEHEEAKQNDLAQPLWVKDHNGKRRFVTQDPELQQIIAAHEAHQAKKPSKGSAAGMALPSASGDEARRAVSAAVESTAQKSNEAPMKGIEQVEGTLNETQKDQLSVLQLQAGYMSSIAQNTAATAHDLRRYALGAGDLGRLGVSAVDMSHAVSRSVGGVHHRLLSAISDFVSEQTAFQIGGMMRQGMVGR